MKQSTTGYRALPETISHPDMAATITETEFISFSDKQKMMEAPSLHEGHDGTNVWYVDCEEYQGYILEILFENRHTIYIKSICTFTPTFGIDQIDGDIAQDVEENCLFKELGRETDRLSIYNGLKEVPIMEYLQSRGYTEPVASKSEKKWWQF